MTPQIEAMLEHIIGVEGGYANHPDDKGGETMWGVTKYVARKQGYLGPMREMPRATALDIYRKEYLIGPGFDYVAEIYPRVGLELFDSGVNLGVKWPQLWLQMCLNALNQQGEHYPDIEEDGDIGPATMRSLKAFKQRRGEKGEEVLLRMLDCLQGARYIEIARARKRNESFIFGWFLNRVGALWKS